MGLDRTLEGRNLDLGDPQRKSPRAPWLGLIIAAMIGFPLIDAGMHVLQDQFLHCQGYGSITILFTPGTEAAEAQIATIPGPRGDVPRTGASYSLSTDPRVTYTPSKDTTETAYRTYRAHLQNQPVVDRIAEGKCPPHFAEDGTILEHQSSLPYLLVGAWWLIAAHTAVVIWILADRHLSKGVRVPLGLAAAIIPLLDFGYIAWRLIRRSTHKRRPTL